jgi:CheY-like chemotaxis protein
MDKIVGIDDEPNRVRTANLLNESSTFEVCFENVKKKDLAEAVNQLLSGPQPALVILDHILDHALAGSLVFRRGSTIAQAVKEKWPGCPVIGVTNIDRLQSIDIRTRATYDDLYPLVYFGKYVDRIDGVAKDFAKITKKKPKSVSDIVGAVVPSEGRGIEGRSCFSARSQRDARGWQCCVEALSMGKAFAARQTRLLI